MAFTDSIKSNENIVVLVTGASGYIALHCIKQLLEEGYSVKGTVRNLQNVAKIQPLRNLKYSAERLKLVEADLECALAWPNAVKGCTYILHIASPWPIVADETIIRIARNGTLNVLKAAAECNTLRKVVLTSSCAAINDGHKNDSQVFDENCWANLNCDQIDNYSRSKIIAERAAWDFWNSLPEDSRFQLTVLNPTFVVGPVLSDQKHGSATVIKRMMDYRTFLAAPKVSLGMVDVRDVARAHICAMRNAKCNGQRILITATPSVWFSQVADWLREEFEKDGFTISQIVAPNWLVKLYAKASSDPHVAAIKHRLGPEIRFLNKKSQELFHMEYTSIKKSVIDMVYSMLDYGMIKRKTQSNLISKLLLKWLEMFKMVGMVTNLAHIINISALIMLVNMAMLITKRISVDFKDEFTLKETLLLFVYFTITTTGILGFRYAVTAWNNYSNCLNFEWITQWCSENMSASKIWPNISNTARSSATGRINELSIK